MDIIPEDVWPLIAKFMDDKTKLWMRLASTQWFKVIKYNDFKLYFARTENIEAISDRLSQYSWPIKVRFNKSKFDRGVDLIKNLPKMTNIIELSTDTSIDELKYMPVSQEQWMQLTVLTNLQSWSIKYTTYYVPRELWTYFPNLTEFNMLRDDADDINSILKKLTDLQALDYYADTKTWPYALVPNPYKLTRLNISTQSQFENGTEVLPQLTNLKLLNIFDDSDNTLNLSYLTALEKLSINGNLPSFATNTNLTHLEIQCRLPSDKKATEFSNLKKLRELIIFVHPEQQGPIDFSFLSDLPYLSRFVITEMDTGASIVPTLLFQNLSPNLNQLVVNAVEVSLTSLTHLTNLESLTFNAPPKDIEFISQLYRLKSLDLYHFNNDQCWRAIEKLTKLEDLSLVSDYSEFTKIDEENLPNIGNLIHLKTLIWDLKPTSEKLLDQLRELTNLVTLEMLVEDNSRLVWKNITALTKLERLDAYSIHNNEELLSLTSLNNLTYLAVRNAGKNFNGIYLTALTSLQSIHFHSTESKMLFKDNLTKIMPYLIEYGYYYYGIESDDE